MRNYDNYIHKIVEAMMNLEKKVVPRNIRICQKDFSACVNQYCVPLNQEMLE